MADELKDSTDSGSDVLLPLSSEEQQKSEFEHWQSMNSIEDEPQRPLPPRFSMQQVFVNREAYFDEMEEDTESEISWVSIQETKETVKVVLDTKCNKEVKLQLKLAEPEEEPIEIRKVSPSRWRGHFHGAQYKKCFHYLFSRCLHPQVRTWSSTAHGLHAVEH